MMTTATFAIPSFVTLSVTDLNEILGRARPQVDVATSEASTVDAPSADAPTVDAPTVDAPTVDAPTSSAPTFQAQSINAAAPLRASNFKGPARLLTTIAGALLAITLFGIVQLRSETPYPNVSWSENRISRHAQNSPSGQIATKVDTDSTGSIHSEKQRISKFLSQRYRKEPYQTEQIVHHAFDIAREVNLDPWLILAVISIESNLNPRAVSGQDARGLMQIHARAHAEKFTPHGGIDMAFDPETNIRVGAAILRDYIDRFAGVPAALKAYVGAALLPHDEGYGAKVLKEHERIATAALGMPSCETGDRSLCKQALRKSGKAYSSEPVKTSEFDSRVEYFLEAGVTGVADSSEYLNSTALINSRQ